MDYNGFQALLRESFVVKFSDGEVRFALVECKRLPDQKGQLREPFSLLFLGPPQPVFPQGIYRLEHAGAGPLELFLVPVGKDAGGVHYEAVFN